MVYRIPGQSGLTERNSVYKTELTNKKDTEKNVYSWIQAYKDLSTQWLIRADTEFRMEMCKALHLMSVRRNTHSNHSKTPLHASQEGESGKAKNSKC